LKDVFDVRVVDVDLGFTALLESFVQGDRLPSGNIVEFERAPKSLRDRIHSGRGRILSLVRNVLGIPYVHWFAHQIDKRDEDLVYFASQSELAARISKPYVWTLWDICHIDSPEFDEVRANGEFERRDKSIWTSVRKAALVIVDSTKSVVSVSHSFGVPEEKLIPVPFSPSPHISASVSNPAEVGSSLRNLPEPYFYYPAQFWGAKNHGRVLDAVAILVNRGFSGGVVFSGNDRGSLEEVRQRASQRGLGDRVRILTYVSDEELQMLFQNAAGLVMASYFGPTNIPPLEAMALGVPVVASAIHREQLGQAALLFDPDSESDLANKLEEVLIPEVAKRLVARGQEHIFQIDQNREAQEALVRNRMIRIAKRISGLQWSEI
jgi:glycosyltransferase involved in cell wall biosynthesis